MLDARFAKSPGEGNLGRGALGAGARVEPSQVQHCDRAGARLHRQPRRPPTVARRLDVRAA